MRWVAIDVETTGLIPGSHCIWEVALVTDDGDEHSWLIEDVKLSNADSKALEVGGFWQRWDVHGVAKHQGLQVARSLSKIVAGRALVGVNPAFDAAFVGDLLRRHNRPTGWHYQLIDVKAMAAGWIANQAAEFDDAEYPEIDLPWSSNDLSLACDVEPPDDDERHTALGDARWAARWYQRLVDPRGDA